MVCAVCLGRAPNLCNPFPPTGFPPSRFASSSTFSAPLLLSLHLTLVRCGERKGGPEKEELGRGVVCGGYAERSYARGGGG